MPDAQTMGNVVEGTGLPHQAGKPPKFEGLGEPAHDRLIEEMRRVYESDHAPTYLDAAAQVLLEEGRAAFRRFGLHETRIIEAEGNVYLFLWRGSVACDVFRTALTMVGQKAEVHDLGLTLTNARRDQVESLLTRFAGMTIENLPPIEKFVGAIVTAKFDEYVPEAVLRKFWARRHRAEIIAIPRHAKELIATTARIDCEPT
jgi:ATP-dependent Lhr-like helicase